MHSCVSPQWRAVSGAEEESTLAEGFLSMGHLLIQGGKSLPVLPSVAKLEVKISSGPALPFSFGWEDVRCVSSRLFLLSWDI